MYLCEHYTGLDKLLYPNCTKLDRQFQFDRGGSWGVVFLQLSWSCSFKSRHWRRHKTVRRNVESWFPDSAIFMSIQFFLWNFIWSSSRSCLFRLRNTSTKRKFIFTWVFSSSAKVNAVGILPSHTSLQQYDQNKRMFNLICYVCIISEHGWN